MPQNTGLLASDLIKLKNLQLVGKLVSEELMLGIHTSKRSGIGTEFEQYRHYQPGDDPKKIDWKLFARSGKHLVRESSTESDRQLRFVLDLSGSMNYTENGISRLRYAQILMASLGYLGYIQNDQVSLYSLQNNVVDTVVANGSSASGRQTFQKFLVGLENAVASGKGAYDEVIRFPEFQQKGTEQLIFVTDFLQVKEEWIQFIKSLANPRREIVIFQILGEEEVHFNLQGFYRFKDLETGKEIELDAGSVKEKYLSFSQTYLEKLKTDLQIPYVRLIRAQLNEPIGMVLKEFLTKRKG